MLPPVESLPGWLQADLRSDHAGELGAVYIYLGILAVSNDKAILDFARNHLETERQHLAFFDDWLERKNTSLITPLWRLSGWVLGALASLGGARAVYITIDAVETFVVEHYMEQVDRLLDANAWPEIRTVLQRFQDDEEHHRQDAVEHAATAPRHAGMRAWQAIVGGGSRVAVRCARLV